MILFFNTGVIFFTCSSVFMVLHNFIFVQTFKTSKQQRQVIKTIPVIIANVESQSKKKLIYLIYKRSIYKFSILC